jgi:hypothetical protein
VCARLESLLDPVEPRIESSPLAGDQVDEDGEILDASVTLGKEVALEPLEPSDRLVCEALDLGETASDRRRLLPEPVPQGPPDGIRQHHLKLVGAQRQRFDLEASPLERGRDVGRERGATVHLWTVTRSSDGNQGSRNEARALSGNCVGGEPDQQKWPACVPTSSTTSCLAS